MCEAENANLSRYTLQMYIRCLTRTSRVQPRCGPLLWQKCVIVDSPQFASPESAIVDAIRPFRPELDGFDP